MPPERERARGQGKGEAEQAETNHGVFVNVRIVEAAGLELVGLLLKRFLR